MDGIRIRAVTEDEALPYLRFVNHGFHEHESDDLLREWLPMWREGRYEVAVSDDEYVGSCATYDTTLSVPGGSVGCAAITAVTVRPDHRRRGLLTRMMGGMFDAALDRGHELAALYVSEGGIYGRYGYGPAVQMRSLEVSAARAMPTGGGDTASVRMVSTARARELAPRLLAETARTQGGLIGVTDHWWDLLTVVDPEDDRDGWTPRTCAVVEDRGLVVFRAKDDGGEDQAGRLKVTLLLATDPDALRALWCFVASVDLVGTIEVPDRPLDDPLLHLVPDEARARLSRSDSLWVRLLDVPAALEARTAGSDDAVIVELTDAQVPGNAGRWRLAGDGVVHATRTDDAAELRLDVSALSSAYLGGVRPSALLRAGRIDQQVPGAVARLGRLLATDPDPWAPFMF